MLKCVLVHDSSNVPAVIGETLTDFRGDKCVLKGWSNPYDAELLEGMLAEGSSLNVEGLNLNRGAKIYCVDPDEADDWQGSQSQYYPSVCGLKFIIQELK